MSYYPIVFIYLLFFISTIFAQKIDSPQLFENHICSISQNDSKSSNFQSDIFEKNYQERWQKYQKEIHTPTFNKTDPTYRIPIVVHIIHDCESLGGARFDRNPSARQVRFQIEKTNLRFRHQQMDAPAFDNPFYGVDTGIELVFATTDPAGNPTTGIVRHNDTELADGTFSEVGISIHERYGWPSDKYMNVYVFGLRGAGGVYSGTTDAVYINAYSFWDGLMCHEVGHYFGLRHSFSGKCDNEDCLTDGDAVCDTPAKSHSGYVDGSCTDPDNNCSTDEEDTSENNPYRTEDLGGMGEQPDMTSNYMDYTFSCWNAFTLGQTARMHSNIETERTTNTTAFDEVCNPDNLISTIGEIDGVDYILDLCEKKVSLKIVFVNYGDTEIQSIKFSNTFNGEVITSLWDGNLEPGDFVIHCATLDLPAETGNFAITTTIDEINDQASSQHHYFASETMNCISIDVPEETPHPPYEETLERCGELPVGFSTFSTTDRNFYSSKYATNSDLASCQDCFFRCALVESEPQMASLSIPTIDFNNTGNQSLYFKYGHIVYYEFINDTLEVVVKNCDTTEEVVLFSKSGNELSTQVLPFEDRMSSFPYCEEIEQVEVPLGEYSSDVQLSFRVRGRLYTPVVIDDIEIRESSPLAINLTTFKGEIKLDHNYITWSVSTDDSPTLFHLQYSSNGTDFTDLATIPYKRGQYRYASTDTEVVNDKVTDRYYRLITEEHNDSSISKSIYLNRNSVDDLINIYPTILRSGTPLTITDNNTQNSWVRIYNMQGKMIKQQQITSEVNIIPTNDLSSGIYLVNLGNDKNTTTKKSIKLLIR